MNVTNIYSLYCHKQSRTGSQLMPSTTLPKQVELCHGVSFKGWDATVGPTCQFVHP